MHMHKYIFDLHYLWLTKIKQVEHFGVRLVLFIQTEGLVWNHRKVHGISRTATAWHQSLDCIVFCFSLIPYDTVCQFHTATSCKFHTRIA